MATITPATAIIDNNNIPLARWAEDDCWHDIIARDDSVRYYARAAFITLPNNGSDDSVTSALVDVEFIVYVPYDEVPICIGPAERLNNCLFATGYDCGYNVPPILVIDGQTFAHR